MYVQILLMHIKITVIPTSTYHHGNTWRKIYFVFKVAMYSGSHTKQPEQRNCRKAKCDSGVRHSWFWDMHWSFHPSEAASQRWAKCGLFLPNKRNTLTISKKEQHRILHTYLFLWHMLPLIHTDSYRPSKILHFQQEYLPLFFLLSFFFPPSHLW